MIAPNKEAIAILCLLVGIMLTLLSTATLFYTSHWTDICIVDAVEKQPIDKTELNRCITTPGDIDGEFLYIGVAGFLALSMSAALALGKK